MRQSMEEGDGDGGGDGGGDGDGVDNVVSRCNCQSLPHLLLHHFQVPTPVFYRHPELLFSPSPASW